LHRIREWCREGGEEALYVCPPILFSTQHVKVEERIPSFSTPTLYLIMMMIMIMNDDDDDVKEI